MNPISAHIDALYAAFADVPQPAHLPSCPCCQGRVDVDRLLGLPLKQLTANDLELYAFKAITTVGDVSDLRWFAPRLLELLVCDELGVDVEIVLGKFGLAQLDTWDAPLRTAVHDVFWAELLRRIVDETAPPAEDWFCGISLAVSDLNPWLLRLDGVEPADARIGVARLRSELRQRDRSAFWVGCPGNLALVQNWLLDRAHTWQTLYEDRGLFLVELSSNDELWISVDIERGAGVVQTVRRRLTADEARAVWDGSIETARLLAWRIHEG